MPIIDRFRYRPEVDGLRAVAVLAVVLYHAGFGCSGGYVGVDVFFVISGFLITSLIWTDLESERFTFGHFWERRARRIAPALIVVTIATLAAGWFILLPSDFQSLGRASASQAVFAANIYYWQSANYFANSVVEMPLLHTWSLAVEEQFYLVVPLLLWGIFRSASLRTRTAVVSVLAVGCILSCAMSVYGVAWDSMFTFYWLPTRAWELLLGSLIAFLPASSLLQHHRSLRELLAAFGLALIFVPIFTYKATTPFPGLAALPPCLGAALLIWVNSRIDGGAPTAMGRLLSIRPLVFLGLISYSLYLWHWPFLAFSHYVALAPLSLSCRVLMVALGFLCAVLSWKYVETPFRNRRLGTSRKTMFAFAGGGLATVLGFGLLCMARQGFPERLSPEARRIIDASVKFEFGRFLNAEDIRSGRLIPIGTKDSSRRPAVLVWGDSHAMVAIPAMDDLLRERGLTGLAVTRTGTPPVLGWSDFGSPQRIAGDVDYNDSVLSYINDRHIRNVILIAYWHRYTVNSGNRSGSKSFLTSLSATIRQLVAAGSTPWIMLDVPHHPFHVVRAMTSPFYSSADIESHCAKPPVGNEPDAKERAELIAQIETAGGHILDPRPRFLDPTGRHYVVEANGTALYRDLNHLTTDGAKLMLLPLFRHSMTLTDSMARQDSPTRQWK